jgi:hypothetical protein
MVQDSFLFFFLPGTLECTDRQAELLIRHLEDLFLACSRLAGGLALNPGLDALILLLSTCT